jgi:RNA-directed DNA polymerase
VEDKIVQQAVVTVLNATYEEDSRGFSYGFRPERSQHMALDTLYVAIKRKRVNWILELDLKSFFDNISKEKLVQLIGKRIADPRVLRLIQKWLQAGVMEDGVWSETEAGTPQGAVISPLLSNVYLHCVLDQWRQKAHGDITIVRYADGAIVGFHHQDEAERGPTHNGRQTTAEETAGNQAGTALEDARADCGRRRMAAERATRLLGKNRMQ